MRILHTEASAGWGGQEMRILREAEGMRKRGHEVLFAAQKEGGLVKAARASGFCVFELNFKKRLIASICWQMVRIIRSHNIDIINTHSSLDSWLGGAMGKLLGRPVIRTRHLSTWIKQGINIHLLYRMLANNVVTTCAETALQIQKGAGLPPERCRSIPTGIDPHTVHADPHAVLAFRERYDIAPDECLAGTLCVLRGWKGVGDLLLAAKQLEHHPKLRWLIIGSGPSEAEFRRQHRALGLGKKVIFTGHLAAPFTALAATDLFLLLSWAHEGVSQASLQAALLEKPLITTETGGLKEVCIPGKTGIIVPAHDPKAVEEAVVRLAHDTDLRREMGRRAKELVLKHFTFEQMLDQMEKLYFKTRISDVE